jgi:hypothetical protein
MVRNKSFKKIEFNLIWVGMNGYIFLLPPMGTISKSHMSTWFNKWEIKKIKEIYIEPPPHAHVLDPTKTKPKGVNILGKGLKKEKKKQGAR